MKLRIPTLSASRCVVGTLLVSLGTAAVNAQTNARSPSGVASSFPGSMFSSTPTAAAAAALEEGRRLIEEERYDEAIGSLTLAINEDAGVEGLGAAPHYLLGRAYQELKEYDEADRLFSTALVKDRNLAAAYNSRGEVRRDLNQPGDALADFKDAVKLDRRNKDFLYNLGVAMSTSADSREVVASEELLTRVIAIDDTMTKAYSVRADVRARLGKFDDAIADYQRAIELEPTEKGYYLNLGSVYAQKQDLIMAVEALTRSFEVHLRAAQATDEGEETEPQEPEPVFVAPLLNRARFLIEMGKQSTDEGMRAEAFRRAVADCDQSIEMLQDAPRQLNELAFAHYQRGIVQEEMEEYEESVRSLTDALRISAGLSGAYSRRGIVWFKLGDDELALIDLNEAVQLNPNDLTAHLYRGFTLVRQEKYREAIAAYTKALERSDQFVPALNNRGLAYFKDGQYAKAIEDFNEMLLINPKDATAYFKRGVTYMVMEDFSRAITALSGATRVDPNYAAAHERLGETYEFLGRVAEARQHYAEAARLRADQGATAP